MLSLHLLMLQPPSLIDLVLNLDGHQLSLSHTVFISIVTAETVCLCIRAQLISIGMCACASPLVIRFQLGFNYVNGGQEG